jgi:hypothetical protein
MATARTGTFLIPSASGAPRWQAGYEYTRTGVYTFSDSVVTADTITWTDFFPPLTTGVQLVGFKLWGDELDTHATPTATVIVGDGTDTDAYIKSFTGGNPATGTTEGQ